MGEGRIDKSWRSPKQKFGNLCVRGEQMVQIHFLYKEPTLRLPYIEDWHPKFSTCGDVVVKQIRSNMFVKLKSTLLIKKQK